ncbi:protein JTB [Folsomia candida]|uniref:Protein JTB n=1 Tax=Folsomia candida TaxID=158441 RepID=A0A226F5R7_FOLCA|nr:protein JTB [Folsomia candida]OXA64531.1 Protein JTB [Folsomia candida]
MIELCTKRRMIISIIALGVLTVIIVLLEEKLTSDPHWSPTPVPQSNDSGFSATVHKPSSSSSPQEQTNCWELEEYKIVAECSRCTQIEINSGSIPACRLTGLKETVHCNISGAFFRSCSDVPSVAKTRFWIFESLMLFTAVVSFGFSRYRTSILERQTIKNIERRLASGM